MLLFNEAPQRAWYSEESSVDIGLLKTIIRLTAGLEVHNCTAKQWKAAILQGYSAFKQLTDHCGGRVDVDLDSQTLTYHPPRLWRTRRDGSQCRRCQCVGCLAAGRSSRTRRARGLQSFTTVEQPAAFDLAWLQTHSPRRRGLGGDDLREVIKTIFPYDLAQRVADRPNLYSDYLRRHDRAMRFARNRGTWEPTSNGSSVSPAIPKPTNSRPSSRSSAHGRNGAGRVWFFIYRPRRTIPSHSRRPMLAIRRNCLAPRREARLSGGLPQPRFSQ